MVGEPTSALDRERRADIVDPIVRLTEQAGTATLLVTHDLVHLPRLHGTVGLVDGRLTPSVGADR